MKYIDISCVNTKNTRNNDRDIYKQSNPFGVAHINIGTINTKFTRDTERIRMSCLWHYIDHLQMYLKPKQ